MPSGQEPNRTPLVRGPSLLARAAATSWRLLLVLAVAVLLLVLLVRLRFVVVPVVVALLLSTVLVPAVDRLRRRGWPNLVATWVVFLGALLGVSGAAVLFVPFVAQDLPGLQTQLVVASDELQRFLDREPFGLTEARLGEYVAQAQAQIAANAQQITSGVLSGAVLIGELIAGGLLTVVLLFFLLKDSALLSRWTLKLFPVPRRDDLRVLGRRASSAIGGYLVGVVIVGAFNGFFIGLGLLLLGVPFALPLAFLTFLSAFLPLVGATTAGLLAALVALVSDGPVTALLVLGLTILVQQVEGHVLSPLVLGRAVHLHPIGVILAIGTGAVLGGVLGAFLAVPTAALAVTVLTHVRERDPPSGGDVPTPAGREPSAIA